jgi:hypothetical protein
VGGRALPALVLLFVACFALWLSASAEAATASSRHASVSRAAQERRVAKVCAKARRTKSKRALRTCRTLRVRLARTTRTTRKPGSSTTGTTTSTSTSTTTTSSGSGSTTTTTTTGSTAGTTTTATAPAGSTSDAPTATTATATSTVPRLYSDSSVFNTRIPSSPRVADNSAAMVTKSLLPYVGSANFANSNDWGISIVSARPTDPERSVGVFDWGYGADIPQPAVRIPDGAQPTLGSDHHLVVLDGDRELDMWVAEQQGDGSWLSGCRTVGSASGSGIAGALAGNAAGFSLAAGVIRPEEIKAGRIEHALVFTSPYVRNTYVAPAVHGDGRQSDVNAMPMGTRIQLNPAIDISGLARPQRIVAQALKDYGAFLVDSSGSLAIRGEASIGRASTGGPSDIWGPVGVTDSSLKAIPWSQMRVIAP